MYVCNDVLVYIAQICECMRVTHLSHIQRACMNPCIHTYIHTYIHKLAAILGGTRKVAGTVELRGKVAYAAQQPWIVNATVRDNVLFGCPYDAEKYNKVIEACAMISDLKVLPSGDLTEIGEKVCARICICVCVCMYVCILERRLVYV